MQIQTTNASLQFIVEECVAEPRRAYQANTATHSRWKIGLLSTWEHVNCVVLLPKSYSKLTFSRNEDTPEPTFKTRRVFRWASESIGFCDVQQWSCDWFPSLLWAVDLKCSTWSSPYTTATLRLWYYICRWHIGWSASTRHCSLVPYARKDRVDDQRVRGLRAVYRFRVSFMGVVDKLRWKTLRIVRSTRVVLSHQHFVTDTQ